MLNSTRNSAEKNDQEVMKHMCRLCNKSFSCGRSLGGHMRSHVINSTDHHHHHQKIKLSSLDKNGGNLMNNNTEVTNGSSNSNELGYELRKDPKKTIIASNDFVVLDKICKECGKGFQSWKALFGHMKCHSNKVSNNKISISNQDPWINRLGNENSSAKIRKIKKSRSRNGTTKKCLVTCASTSVVSDIDHEQEAEIAMCLIMLSKDVGKWGKKLEETEIGFDFFGKLEKTTTEFDDQSKTSHKKLKESFNSNIHDKNMIKTEPMLDHDHMTNGYCEKTSENHQPPSSFNLGGSLKNTMVIRAHECSICLRIFSSGQALGGHKRSHLIAEAKLNQQNANLIEKLEKPVQEIRGFLDLNMPPDDPIEEGEEQETMMMNTSTTGTGYNPWTLLGLLSTS